MARRDTARRVDAGAVVLGILWVLGGVLLAATGLLRFVPSLYALGAIALLAGVLGVAASFLPNSTASLWGMLAPAALLVGVGLVLVRFPTLEVHAVAALAAVGFLASGLFRLGAAREFVEAWRPFLVAGLVSVFLGLVLVSGLLEPTTTGVAFLLGCDLLVSGVVLIRNAGR